MFKLSKVKGGNVAYIEKMKKIKGRGTPAVRKIDNQEVISVDMDLNNIKGSGIKKSYTKSIKPLVFKM